MRCVCSRRQLSGVHHRDCMILPFRDAGNYAANELYKTITYDENTAAIPSESAGSTVEFKDKEGRVI